MENIPKLQSGLTMKLFKEKADMALDEIISQFPTPRIISFPKYLTYYAASFISQNTQKKYTNFIPMSQITPVDYAGSIFIITTSDSSSIDEALLTFKKLNNFLKVILVIPRVTEYVRRAFSNEQYQVVEGQQYSTNKAQVNSSQVILYDFPADFLPMGNDFFLLPSINSYYKINILSDFEDIYNSARALFRIESVFGDIPHIMCAGINAIRAQQVLNQFNSTPSKVQMDIPQIDSLIIIDRCVDLLTPLITEVSIEGIINVSHDIQYSIVKSDPKDPSPTTNLSETNEVFRTIRMMSWERMINFCSTLQKKIEEKITELTRDGAQMNKKGILHEKYFEAKYLVENLRENTKNLYNIANEGLKKLKQRNPAFEETFSKEFQVIDGKKSALDFAENLVLLYNDWSNALRLICLESICGWKKIGSSDISKIQSEIINEFGISAVREGLLNLEKANLISTNESKVTLASCLHKLDIWGKVDDTKNPIEACATAFGGYVPPSVRFVQRFTNGDIEQLSQEFAEKIPIAEFGKKKEREKGDPRRIIVFFVGGITLTEAGTIRNMGRSMYNGEVEFIIGSTDKISYNTFLEQLCPFLHQS